MNSELLSSILTYVIPVLLAITLHEASHGYVARQLGDDTAERLGRITLNPFKHIDPWGTIALPALLYWMTKGQFVFGYAKPVPVNMNRFSKPRQHMAWVALAGPVSNLVQALIWAILGVAAWGLGIHERFLIDMAQAGVLVNITLCVLNLLPLPPLDGGRVATGVLPPNLASQYDKVTPWGFMIVLGLMYVGWLSDYWMRPLTMGFLRLFYDFLPGFKNLFY